MARELKRQEALAHRGACRHDVESPVLEPAEQAVEIADARRKPGYVAIVLGCLLEAVDLLGERVLEQPLAGEHIAPTQREDQSFSFLDQPLSPTPSLADLRLDLIGCDQQRSHQRVIADDPTVFAGGPGRRHPSGEFVDRTWAADLLEATVLPERFGDGQVIDLGRLLVQLQHRSEHERMLLAVEVLGAELLVGEKRVEVTFVEQCGAKD